MDVNDVDVNGDDIDAFSGDPPPPQPPQPPQPQQPPQRFIKQAHRLIQNDQKNKLKTAAIEMIKKGMQTLSAHGPPMAYPKNYPSLPHHTPIRTRFPRLPWPNAAPHSLQRPLHPRF